jgi:hypothetical protein
MGEGMIFDWVRPSAFDQINNVDLCIWGTQIESLVSDDRVLQSVFYFYIIIIFNVILSNIIIILIW